MEENWRPIFGDSLEFQTAIDRRDLESGLLPTPKAGQLHPFYQRRLTRGEIACTLSHISALEQHLGRDEGAIIMEDDVAPEPHAALVFDLIQAARSEVESLDALILCKPINAFRSILRMPHVSLPDPNLPPFGTTMVWYGPRALEEQIDRMSRFDTPTDHWQDFCRAQRLGVLTLPIAIHVGTETYIGNAHRQPASYRNYLP